MVIDGDLLSEDYFLNYLMRCAKIPIIADTKIKLRQIEPTYNGKDLHVYPEGEFPPIPAYDERAGEGVEVVDVVVQPKKP